MTTWVVTRHLGARDWFQSRDIVADVVVEHLDDSQVKLNDLVIGNLPINLVATINERGARYLHLTLTVSAELRGVELSAEQMELCGATLEEYRVQRIGAL